MVDKTPTPEVLLMNRVSFTGNVIPHSWYQKLKFASGKANLAAIVVLAEICYWYRPVEVRDESTGELLRLEKKFFADKLQRKYESFESLGITKKQAYDACHYLESIGLITLETRTVTTKTGLKIPNILFIGVDPRAISCLNQPLKEGESPLLVGNGPLHGSNDTLPTSNGPLPTGNTCTESSSEISKETSSDTLADATAPQPIEPKTEALAFRPFVLSLPFEDRVMSLYNLSLKEDEVEHIPNDYRLDAGIDTGTVKRKISNKLRDRLFTLASYLANMPVSNDGEVAKRVKQLTTVVQIGTYTEKEIYACAIWAENKNWFRTESFAGYSKSLHGILKLLDLFQRDYDKKLLNAKFAKPENSSQRAERIMKERNKEEIIENAAKFDERRAKVFGEIT
jgi:hypothetical protein